MILIFALKMILNTVIITMSKIRSFELGSGSVHADLSLQSGVGPRFTPSDWAWLPLCK